jgi:hypothetical protein
MVKQASRGTKMFRHLYRGVAIFLVAVLLMVVFAVPALAFDARAGSNITVTSDEVVQGDLYVAGTSIVINGIVHGDIFGAAQTLTINGVVTGGVTFAGQTLTLNGEVLHGVRFAGTDININGHVGRDLIAAGSAVTLSGQARMMATLYWPPARHWWTGRLPATSGAPAVRLIFSPR